MDEIFDQLEVFKQTHRPPYLKAKWITASFLRAFFHKNAK